MVKYIIIVTMVALGILSTIDSSSAQNALHDRSKRSIFSCPVKIPKVTSECLEKLNDELDLDSKVAKELNEDTPGQFKCCYIAKFNYCLKSQLESECSDFSTGIANLVTGPAKVMLPQCDQYTYPSVTCIFFVWFYYIIAAIAIFVLLSLGCCIARCICGRK